METRTRMTPKSFRFTTALEWIGGRAALLRDEGRLEFRVAPPPEFRGEANTWSPEHLLVAALDSCLMITFAGLAEKEGLAFLAYTSAADGTLEWQDGGYRFTAFTLRPSIAVASADEVERARALLERAHATCLVAASLAGRITVEPAIAARAD